MYLPPKHRGFAAKAPISTRTYRGPDRRDDGDRREEEIVVQRVTPDANDNPVFDERTNVSRRREDSRTNDSPESLNSSKLNLDLTDD